MKELGKGINILDHILISEGDVIETREELGFIGTTIIVLLYSVVMLRGFLAATRIKDSFGSNLAVGLTLLIGFQAFTNMGVAVGHMPTKGLALPFISLCGSALLVSMLCVGVLLNITEHAAKRR